MLQLQNEIQKISIKDIINIKKIEKIYYHLYNNG